MKVQNNMQVDEVQNLLAEYEALQKVLDQFYTGNLNVENKEKVPTRKYNVPEKSLQKITSAK